MITCRQVCRDFPALHGFSRSPAGNFLHFMVFLAHLQGFSCTSWFFSLTCRDFPALHGFSRSLAGNFPHFMVFLARLQGISCTSWFFPLTCREFPALHGFSRSLAVIFMSFFICAHIVNFHFGVAKPVLMSFRKNIIYSQHFQNSPEDHLMSFSSFFLTC